MNVVEYFFASAERAPEKPALVIEGRSFTYGELERTVRRLLDELLATPHEPLVALLASRSMTAYAGVLAILASGRAYVPLNPAFPPSRNRYILERTGARTVLCGRECRPHLEGLIGSHGTGWHVIGPEGESESIGNDTNKKAPPRRQTFRATSATDPAYVLFTSGSTGKPKGVVVRHGNVRAYVEHFNCLYAMNGDDRASQLFDLTFDLSVHDMFVTWAAGATLVVYPPEALVSPIPYTSDQRVTVWFSVPSAVAHLEASRRVEVAALPALRLSLFCGEKLTENAWRLWRDVAPESRIVNLYGPTETTIAITHFEVPRGYDVSKAPHGSIPIGRPFPGQLAELRRADGSMSAPGEPGELWLSGDQIAAGYFGDPELTARRFVEEEGRTFYRTGDTVVHGPDDELVFVGRDDAQVKVMGYRVELGEVEHALMQAAGCTQAVVLLGARDGIEELVAILPSHLAPRKRDLRRALADALPAYMLPRRYVFVPQFPLNANGKVDRAGLNEHIRACL